MVDTSHSLQHASFNFMVGGWSPWKKLGGKLLGPPAVANSKGTIHIFHIGADCALYHKIWDGVRYTPDQGYERLGGTFIHTPAAVSAGAEEVSVFAVGLTDGRLHHYHWKSSSGWDPVAELPGLWAGTPSTVSHQEGCWDVFGVAPSEATINHVSYNKGEQLPLEQLRAHLQSIDAISWAPGRIDLIGWGLDSAVFHIAWEHGSWGKWEGLGGSIALRPTPVTHSPGALCVLAIATDSAMHINIRAPGTGIWGGWTSLSGAIFSRAA
ncbi:hypothetical protein JB92DRAFT_3030700 [Gautieria morchelliformis]|nr:hypothetical protein JB92DRAFT_3030700 [Gautieria morchelliformis]